MKEFFIVAFWSYIFGEKEGELTNQCHVSGRQLLFEPIERVVSEVWNPDASLPRPPPAEARGAPGISPKGDQKRAQGDLL